MLYVTLLAGLLAFAEASTGKHPSPKQAQVAADKQALLKQDATYEGVPCSSDEDCGNAKDAFCNYDGVCEMEAFPCYDDDECRGKQVCDMKRYICVNPTPSPTTTQEPGCCAGDSERSTEKCNAKLDRDLCDRSSSCHFVVGEDADCSWHETTPPEEPGCCFGNPDAAYSKRWMDQCTTYYTQRDCEMLSDDEGLARCRWESLGENYDCSLLWPTTTTTTEEIGCCRSGDSYKANDKCSRATDRARCEDMGCEFLVTDDPEDCAMTTTATPTTTEEPGCCYGEGVKDNAMCAEKVGRDQCERSDKCTFRSGKDADCTFVPTTMAPGCCRADSFRYQSKCLDSNQMECERMNNCDWILTDDASDCVITTTTEEPEPGCCMGETMAAHDRCVAYTTPIDCERSDRCNWNHGEDADCTFVTDEPEEPGCCYGNTALEFSARWMDACVMFANEKECLKLTDGNGMNRCEWQTSDEDCEVVWPTTTETPSGCCYGDNYKANGKCNKAGDQGRCESNGCTWLLTDDPEDCAMTTSTTTEEPGCCYGEGVKENAMCAEKVGREQCERSGKCEFRAGENAECMFVPTTTTEEPGCCFMNPDIAYSKRWMDACVEFFTERECLLLTNSDGEYRCAWEPLGVYGDCEQLWPTTTETPTPAPGCCKAQLARHNDRCLGSSDEEHCERMAQCDWVVTDDASDCVVTTTTEEPEPGCCMGETKSSHDRCVAYTTPIDCERSDRCNWNHGEDADCTWVTDEPEEPGCCYINPDTAYSSRWMEACVNFGSEAECLMLANGDGVPRCHWEIVGRDSFDCSLLWPTTTETPTEPAGCCYADSYKANDKCARATSKGRCEDMGCSFLETDDPSDCEMTTTKTPTTTEEPGCCYGDSARENAMCAQKIGRDQCERSDSCEFRSGEDADCTFVPTTTTVEPGCCYGDNEKSNEMCAGKVGRDECERSDKCEFRAGEYADCELPTTTSEPWMGAKPEVEQAMEQAMEQPKPKKPKTAKGATAESAVFGGDIVGEGMNTEVSLTTLLMLAAAAFVLFQAYRWWSNRKLKNELDAMARAPETHEAQYYQSA